MNKNDIKRILMSLRINENEDQLNNILGKIDLIPEERLQQIIAEIGNDEESIKKYLEEKLNKNRDNRHEKHTPINDMFEYGTAGNCIHLHMPVDLHEMISKKGIKNTLDTVNLYLLDAVEKIKKLQNDGFYRFNGKDGIYMISPILVEREMRFLEELDFETHSYKKRELQNEDFTREHPEAQLAVRIFGKDSNVGIAKISFEIINSEQWQVKRKQKVEQFMKQGITLNEGDKIKSI